MSLGYVVGLDAGTTGCKAALIDAEGNFISSAFLEYPVITGSDGKAEQDAELVFESCKRVIKQALQKGRVSRVDAISMSVQGDAVVPVDETNAPVSHCILGMDYRPQSLCEELQRTTEPHVFYRKTGMPLHPINSALKILWLQRNVDLSRAVKFMTYSDFLTARFTGNCLIDTTMASRTMLCDLHTGDWSFELLEQFSIPRDMLSEIIQAGSAAGELDKRLCGEFGLENTPVVIAGAHDQPCCALGAGISREGMAVNSMGTAEVMSTILSSPLLKNQLEEGSFPCYRHAQPGFYFTFSLNHTSGIILRWFRDTMCGMEVQEARRQEKDFYEYIQQGMRAEPAPILMLPHFNGRGTPNAQAHANGMFAGVTLSTTKQDLLKGIMDCLCFELRMNIEYLENCGIPIDTLHCVGGGSRSEIWLQSKADILNRRIDIPKNSESGCLGAGILAAVGAGLYPNIADAQRAMTGSRASFYPRPDMHGRYRERYEAFQKLYRFSDEIDAML